MRAKLLVITLVVGHLIVPSFVEAAYLTQVSVTVHKPLRTDRGGVTLQIRYGRIIIGEAKFEKWNKKMISSDPLDQAIVIELDRTIVESASEKVKLFLQQAGEGTSMANWEVEITGQSNDGVKSELVDRKKGEEVKGRSHPTFEWKFEKLVEVEDTDDKKE